MHLMMITQTREQVSVQVISTLALQVQLKHKELNYHLIMYNLSTILPTFQTPHISQSDNHCPLFEFSGFFIHSKSKHSDGPHLSGDKLFQIRSVL